MFPDIPYEERRNTKSEWESKCFPFWYVIIWIIIGTLIVTTVVFSVASCKEQRKLEQEREALQKSRDSLEQRMITIPPMPATPPPAIEGPGMTEDFHCLFSAIP